MRARILIGDKWQVINNIVKIERDTGDIKNIYSICGMNGSQCDNCNGDNYCGRYFVYYSICDNYGNITVYTRNNITIVDDYEILDKEGCSNGSR